MLLSGVQVMGNRICKELEFVVRHFQFPAQLRIRDIEDGDKRRRLPLIR